MGKPAKPVTRASHSVWLIGKPEREILGSGLPTNGAALRNVLYHHMEKKLSIKERTALATGAILAIWKRARVPTQRKDSCIRKLRKLYDQYHLVRKNRTRKEDASDLRAILFKNDLDELFDVSQQQALANMKIEEDKQFLQLQREDTSSSSMAGVDMCLANMEKRKRARKARETAQKEKCARNEKKFSMTVPSTSLTQDPGIPAFSESDDDADDGEWQQPVGKKRSVTSDKMDNDILTPEVVASLDRANIPDRGAMFVLGTAAQALGRDLDDVALSRSTIRRARIRTREELATAEQETFSSDTPLLLHWDGKMLPDITSNGQHVDRVAILVTGETTEQLLAVPKIERGTGKQQCDACLEALDDWQLQPMIRGLVFDTTSANTGLHSGACILLEKALGRELVWIGCRHHVFEVMLSSVFKACLGSTTAPEIQIFKKFRKNWAKINQSDFHPAGDDVFIGVPESLREDMLAFYEKAIKSKSARADYDELLELCHLFLGGSHDGKACFRAPGAIHNARWMAKALYALKMFLFMEQTELKADEAAGLTEFCCFVALVYARYWHEAALPEMAPLNDLNMIQQLHKYPVRKIRQAALTAFYRHLWSFSEHLVPLALFDDRVDEQTKAAMTRNLARPPRPAASRRLDAKQFDHRSPLQDHVTSRSMTFFDLVSKNGREEANQFLYRPPASWPENMTYTSMKAKVKMIRVVNDCAERSVALIQKFNTSLTKNEQQKQFLLRLIASHRKQLGVASKVALKAGRK